MDNITTQNGNLTDDVGYVGSPSVWNIIKSHIGNMVNQAINTSHFQVTGGSATMDRFKLRFQGFLGNPLNHVTTALRPNRFHSIHKEIKEAVEGAVDSTMVDLNMTVSNSSIKDSLVDTLDAEIESDVISQVFSNTTDGGADNSNFFDSLPIKDETIFVALVSMGAVIPIIFITLLVIFLYKRKQATEERRQEMLLRDQPEFSMDDYNPDDKSQMDEGVPDLDFKRLRV